jgi:trehalose 6-phosphate phosphatase
VARPLGDDDVVATLAAASPLVILLDIDGTLAPIAPRPEDARVPAETSAVLRRLVARPDTHVALVTGRVAADARAMVDADGLWVVGNHGAERIAPDGATAVDDAVAPYEVALASAATSLAGPLAAIPGVLVEFKRWSLAVHYRLADRARVPEVEALVLETAAREGLRTGSGKEVLELRPPADVNKGTAVLALLDRFGARGAGAGVLFAGDDVTDEDAFRRLGGDVPDALTVRVGPPDVETAARCVVDDPAAVRQLLERLAPPA